MNKLVQVLARSDNTSYIDFVRNYAPLVTKTIAAQYPQIESTNEGRSIIGYCILKGLDIPMSENTSYTEYDVGNMSIHVKDQNVFNYYNVFLKELTTDIIACILKQFTNIHTLTNEQLDSEVNNYLENMIKENGVRQSEVTKLFSTIKF